MVSHFFVSYKLRAVKRSSTTTAQKKPLNINGMLSCMKDLISEIGKWVHFNFSEMSGTYT